MNAIDGHTLAQTTFCREPNCPRESLGAAMGPYANLCDQHTEEARKKNSASRRNGAAKKPKPAVKSAERLAEEGFERKARGLVKVGRRLDTAIYKYRPAKEELDQAIEGWRTVCRALAGEEPKA